MLKKILKHNFIPFSITIGFCVVIYLIGRSIPQENIALFVKNAGIFAPIIFILLTLTTYIIAPLSGTPFLYAGFMVFQENTVFYTTAAAIIASVINFLIARRFGRKIVIKIVGIDEITKVDKFMENHGLQSVFLSRIFLGMFHDVISYLSGLTNLKFWPYFLVSTLGMVPGNVFIYFLSTKINSPFVYISSLVAIGYTFLAIVIIYKKLRKTLPP